MIQAVYRRLQATHWDSEQTESMVQSKSPKTNLSGGDLEMLGRKPGGPEGDTIDLTLWDYVVPGIKTLCSLWIYNTDIDKNNVEMQI